MHIENLINKVYVDSVVNNLTFLKTQVGLWLILLCRANHTYKCKIKKFVASLHLILKYSNINQIYFLLYCISHFFYSKTFLTCLLQFQPSILMQNQGFPLSLFHPVIMNKSNLKLKTQIDENQKEAVFKCCYTYWFFRLDPKFKTKFIKFLKSWNGNSNMSYTL